MTEKETKENMNPETNAVEETSSSQSGQKEETVSRKRRRFSFTKILTILLIAAIVFLGLSVYAYKNRHQIAENVKKDAITQASAKAEQNRTVSSATPLPTELTDSSSITLLVDKTHTLPKDYVPSDLTTPYLNSSTDAIQLRQEAADKAKEMKNAAADAGIQLVVSAGYRSYEEQSDYYNNRLAILGEGEVDRQVEKAGASEHQTGLAIDFTNAADQTVPTSDFVNTDACRWLYEHAHEYGFILRYPEGKEEITGYEYTPWHYRYVGVDTANAMYAISPDETFEEYFNVLK
jgi:D-alanyl-D-alanine carboxypeptidase